ncbi:TerB N-terminal domain-containing protein [Thermoflavimicrobium dichotomicum]|uniref:TM2 domain-containing protein n=1 Tax=Thermoflavimicrobium dichotomicum TaxID=46223 RepID=A0A1I3MRQ5_9BACL|nr:TerB N-terminal domain-containing protein [Thermoflavimicrobium dichotomicum]SFI99639.1 TM2 domain-containing protein [Thermoflavimicrobium dichotomicum]
MRRKTKKTAYLLALFLGWAGGHHFYLNHTIRGFLYLLFFWTYIPFILTFIDLLFISQWVDRANRRFETDIASVQQGEERNPNREQVSITVSVTTNQETEKVKNPIQPRVSNNLWYDEESVILPKYRHLRTPESILKSLRRLERSNTQLIGDSWRYRNETRTHAVHESLFAYWTTYRDLNQKQKEWYFYWRAQALQQNYLETGLSYIILFTYELINFSFNENAAFNVSMLARLRDAYKEKEPRVCSYLDHWIPDLLLELDEHELATEWMQQSDDDPLYQYLKEHQNDLSRVSITKLNSLLNKRKSEFFKKHKNKIYNTFKELLVFLNELYARQNLDLIEKWMPARTRKDRRYLYTSAVLDREPENRERLIKVKERIPSELMIYQLNQLLRLAENLIRERLGEKRKVKVDHSVFPEGFVEQAKEWVEFRWMEPRVKDRGRFVKVKSKDSMSTHPIPEQPVEVAEENKQPEVVIDFMRVKQLKDESDELIDIFEQYRDDTEETLQSPVEVTTDTLTSGADQQTGQITEEEWSPFGEPDVHGDIESLWNRLSETEKEWIRLFRDGRLSVVEAAQFLKSRSFMLGVFLNDLNEKAMETLGDVLVEQDGDYLVINEEFSEIIHT